MKAFTGSAHLLYILLADRLTEFSFCNAAISIPRSISSLCCFFFSG
jgi:hypothetical protein